MVDYTTPCDIRITNADIEAERSSRY